MIATAEVSPLLVFAVGGRIGSGCSWVRDGLRNSLHSFGYTVELIDVSRVFLEQIGRFVSLPETTIEQPLTGPLPADAYRVHGLQRSGNHLRKELGNEAVAALCVNEVIRPHSAEHSIIETGTRQAYIIDSLKHPAEVIFLRKIFRDAFYMVGVVASDRVRLQRLTERKGFDESTFDYLSSIDANDESESHGQNAVEAVTLADYFFVNDSATREEIQSEAERLMKLIFGVDIVSPRQDEVGMQVAYKAANRSACLSRQVGAAIFSSAGEILATGHNDVPQFAGGLYTPESRSDERCHLRGGKCYNDEEKSLIVDELLRGLRKAGVINAENGDEASKIIRQSRIKQLIEFSRAVHAETDAIIGVARAGKLGIIGSTLYCTTFPCHNCAKHIIDAGIQRVVYLEPYEKSLARKLHADAISSPQDAAQANKVTFDLYGGASPARFDAYFKLRDRRKINGKFTDHNRERTTLIPVGAQEKNVILERLDFITAKIGAAVERVKPCSADDDPSLSSDSAGDAGTSDAQSGNSEVVS